VAWTALPLAPPRPQIVGGTASPIVPVAASTAPAAETQPRVATADLEEYLLAHQPYSDTSAMRGWAIRSAPPGFRIVGELTRTLGGKPGVGHIVLSDGLAAISVFIEPAKQPARAPGLVRQGAINIYMRPLGDYWVTVVGEAPAESVKYVADAVDFRK
jgi:sigma-E factor negative regulatory protein RseB